MRFRGALFTMESMRGERMLATGALSSNSGAPGQWCSPTQPGCSQLQAPRICWAGAAQTQARLPYSSLRGAPQPNTKVTMLP